jgi:uncharacterized protein YcbX
MIVTANNNNFITQRQIPKMALIKTSLSAEHLMLDFPGKQTIKAHTHSLSRLTFFFFFL